MSLHNYLQRLGRLFGLRKQRERQRRTKLQVEILEDRLVLTSVNLVSVNDMTYMAQQFQPQPGPTILALNFDGQGETTWDGKTVSVTPFRNTDLFNSDPSAANSVDQDIQAILYRVSEVFSPFNVEVIKQAGSGTVDRALGATTIFVGQNTLTAAGQTGVSESLLDGPSADDPTHAPNSDKYDIGYVAPSWAGNSLLGVVGGIAHEAGHTFGLNHVVSGSTPDVMSYSAANNYFADTAFSITTMNASGPTKQPQWNDGGTIYDLTTQDSYSYLQTVLGSQPADGVAHVADPTTIDPGHPDLAAAGISLGSSLNGSINRPGDYNVYQVAAPAGANQSMFITVQPTSGNLDPVVMVYDGSGTLVAFNHDFSVGRAGAQVSITVPAGATYKIVVGAENGASTGNYTVAAATAAPSGYTWSADNSEHIVYRDVDNHVHELWHLNGTSTWSDHDMTADPNLQAVAAAGDPMGYTWSADNSEHIVYRGVDNHIHELWHLYGTSTWSDHDMTADPNLQAVAAAGDPMGYTWSADNSEHIVYLGMDNDVHELRHLYGTSTWSDHDMTTDPNLQAVPATGAAATSASNAAPTPVNDLRPMSLVPVLLGHGSKSKLVVWVLFSDGSMREIVAPMQSPTFHSITPTLVDLNGDGTPDAIQFTGVQSKKLVRLLVPL
jgi:hypothetical protein